MNIYLFELIGKWISTLILCFINLIDINLKTDNMAMMNDNITKSSIQTVELVMYDTNYIYNNKIPYNINNVIVKGEQAVSYVNSKGDKILLREATNEIIEQGLGYYGNYKGRLTSYGPDCPGCSKTGTVSCKTVNNESYSLIKDGVFYNDEEYGNVRILAATRKVFPCGTIVKVSNDKTDTFYGIIMDTGGDMIKAWDEGYIWMDAAYNSQEEAFNAHITSSQTFYEVQRWGW